jgi:glycosyltransferase involved in cell wall biosynthesis
MNLARRLRLLVEGWRGINRSFALVNQHQLLQLRGYRGIALFHRDMPFIDAAWGSARNDAGFDAGQRAALESVPAPDDAAFDAIYRMDFPYRMYGAEARRVSVFIISENHRLAGCFYDGPECSRYPGEAVRVVTCSNWSKAGIIEHGIAAEPISVVPLGVDPEIFHPANAAEILETRAALDIAEDAVVFLNVSALSFNKGVDKLVTAFCRLKKKHPRIVLALKDQSSLYGLTSQEMLRRAAAEQPELVDARALSGMRLLSDNLSLAQMRLLYGCADAYVSCYRAEGFNLPPLEAAACGVPVLLTAGGSTDDYAQPSFALRIASARTSSDRHGNYLEPDLDSLIAGMEQVIERRMPDWDAAAGIAWISENLSWAAVTGGLVRVITGAEPAALT